MKKLLNQLIQLQELYFALEEHRLSLKNGLSSELEKDIEILSSKLPPDKAELFQKLQGRGGPAIVPAVDGTCYGCGIDLPTYMTPELLRFENIYQCPSCARYLYPYTEEKLAIRPGGGIRQLPRLGIDKFSSESLMLPSTSSQDAEGIIRELSQAVADELNFPQPELLINKAMEREGLLSTALEQGLAFPHVRGFDGGSLTLAVGLNKKGIKFGGPSNRLTRIFFFAVIPLASSAFYLKLLAGLAEAFREKEQRDELLECEDPKTLWKTLKKATRKYIA